LDGREAGFSVGFNQRIKTPPVRANRGRGGLQEGNASGEIIQITH
jgi:hypothetical protein